MEGNTVSIYDMVCNRPISAQGDEIIRRIDVAIVSHYTQAVTEHYHLGSLVRGR